MYAKYKQNKVESFYFFLSMFASKRRGKVGNVKINLESIASYLSHHQPRCFCHHQQLPHPLSCSYTMPLSSSMKVKIVAMELFQANFNRISKKIVVHRLEKISSHRRVFNRNSVLPRYFLLLKMVRCAVC